MTSAQHGCNQWNPVPGGMSSKGFYRTDYRLGEEDWQTKLIRIGIISGNEEGRGENEETARCVGHPAVLQSKDFCEVLRDIVPRSTGLLRGDGGLFLFAEAFDAEFHDVAGLQENGGLEAEADTMGSAGADDVTGQ